MIHSDHSESHSRQNIGEKYHIDNVSQANPNNPKMDVKNELATLA